MFSAAPLLSPLLNSPDANLPARVREELTALGREPNTEMVFEGMIALGRNLSREGRPDLAAALFSSVTQTLENEFTGRPENHAALRARAQRELDAIEGRGGLGMRAEFLSRHLAREATHPVGIAGMAFAGLAFSSVRVGMLSRLLGSQTGGFFTRGLGARALASTVAFGVEVPTFVFSGRILNEAIGLRQDWTLGAMRRDLAGNALVLGALKLSGWGATSAYQRMAGANSRPVLQGLFNQAGMFTGIVAGHRAEEFFGLRPHLDNATTLTDSLAMLLQFNVAGRLMQGAMGSRFSGLQRELHLRSQALDHRSSPSEGGPRSTSWAAVLESLLQPSALSVTPEVPSSGRDGRFSNLILMASSKGEGSGRRTRRGLGPSSESSAPPTPRPSEKDLPSPSETEELKPTQRFESSNPPAAESRDVGNAATEMAALPPPAVVNPATISSTEAVRIGAARTEVRVELPPRSDREGILPPPEAVVSPMGATEGTLSPDQLVGVNLPPARIRTSLKGNYASGARLGPDGRYEVIELIGKGGFGEVYKVHDTALDRYSAIKILQDPTRADLLELFLAERRMTARLDPRHAVVVYDTFRTESGQPTQVMEFLDGYNFNQLLRAYFRNEPLESENGRGFDLNELMSLPNRFQMVADMLEALHSAHERGVIHRDVKPENIQWRRNGQIQFLDFGIGKESTEVSEEVRMSLPPPEPKGRAGRRARKQTTVSGTRGYIAPERWGNVENPRSVDVFAMAVVAYEMMSGAHPWAEFIPNPNYSESTRGTEPELILNREANSDRTLLAQFAGIMPEGVRKEPPMFRQILTGELPPWMNEVEAVIRQGLRFNPAERPSTLREMREAWLLAPARTEFTALNQVRLEMKALHDEVVTPRWIAAKNGLVLPAEGWEHLYGPVEELIQRRKSWEKGISDLITQVAGIIGDERGQNTWIEGHRLIAELNMSLLNDGGDFIPKDVRDDFINEIRRHDRPLNADDTTRLSIALDRPISLEFLSNDLRTGIPVNGPIMVRIFPYNREVNHSGRETMNFLLEESPAVEGFMDQISNNLRLPVGYYAIEVSHPEYAAMRVPLHLTYEDAGTRRWNDSEKPFSRRLEFVPRVWVPEGFVVIQGGEAKIGQNFYEDQDLSTGPSFPTRRITLRTMAMTRDMVTVGEYAEFINDRISHGASVEELASLLPRTTFGGSPKLSARFKAVMGAIRRDEVTVLGREAGYYWEVRAKGMGKKRIFRLVDPTSHVDPFEDPIHAEQPVQAISSLAAHSFAQWRFSRDKLDYDLENFEAYDLPTFFEKTAIDGNFFGWPFTWGHRFDPQCVTCRAAFPHDSEHKSLQRVGIHPSGNQSRDRTVFGTRDNLGNAREFTTTEGEPGTILLSGGSIRHSQGVPFRANSLSMMSREGIMDGMGAFRLVLRFKTSR